VILGVAVLLVGTLAGATAAIAGFGIGSLLTPLLAAPLGTAAAIAAVSIPHAIATALRTWRLRTAIDLSVLRRFGLVSAAGGFAGGLLHTELGTRALTLVLGALLIATALIGLRGLPEGWTPRGGAVTGMGLLSGFFGGIAGNQGGLRASALMAFRLEPRVFVATSTATGLLVDAARTPIYVWKAGSILAGAAPLIAIATVGVVAGTLIGERILLGMRPVTFRRIVSGLIGLLGIWLLASALLSGTG
jgi:uncharacterized membrane protein YfcA